jgi:hypothetical protein
MSAPFSGTSHPQPRCALRAQPAIRKISRGEPRRFWLLLT